jgi:adenylate kinase
MKLIFFGPPGAGKGTQAYEIAKVLNVAHISMGDILRSEIKKGSELGVKVKYLVDNGKFVHDEIILEIIKNRILQNDCNGGFIFDGFPRTIEQAKFLEDIVKIDYVVNIKCDDDEIIKRLSSRWMCQCGRSYTFLSNSSDINSKICESCGSSLFQRDDDKPEVVANRIKTYHELTSPIQEFYKKKGILIEINGVQSVDGVFCEILDKLNIKK